jgi:hypothetical protein
MNIKNYKIKKEQGNAIIVKAGGGYAYSVKRFSNHDGSEIDADVESVSISTLSRLREELLLDAESIREMIEDIDALTTDTVAQENASHSKDLYKWLG